MIVFSGSSDMKNQHGIYGIVNTESGRIYIGQTKQSFYRRYLLHDWKLRNNTHDNQHLQNAYNKYGESAFEFIIVESIGDSKDSERLNDLEKKYIDHYKSIGLCYNILDGGGGRPGCPMSDRAKKIVGEKNRVNMLGRKHSEETKRKMRLASKHKKLSDEHKRRLVDINTGRKNTEESKEKMRQSHLGSKNKHSVLNESQAADIKKTLMERKKSINEIAEMYGVHRKVISSVLHRVVWKQVHVDGFDLFADQFENKKYSII